MSTDEAKRLGDEAKSIVRIFGPEEGTACRDAALSAIDRLVAMAQGVEKMREAERATWTPVAKKVPDWTDDNSVRVLVYTEDYDFGGVQVHDIPVQDFYSFDRDYDDEQRGTEVTRCASHWMYRDAAAPQQPQPAEQAPDVSARPRRRATTTATRRAGPRRERKATPPWADQGLIRDLFKLARIYTETLGVTHRVDHRVPLTHRIVCGLHTPANLEVVPLAENVRKSNNWWPDMPETQGELL
jgi:hypothetical protein